MTFIHKIHLQTMMHIFSTAKTKLLFLSLGTFLTVKLNLMFGYFTVVVAADRKRNDWLSEENGKIVSVVYSQALSLECNVDVILKAKFISITLFYYSFNTKICIGWFEVGVPEWWYLDSELEDLELEVKLDLNNSSWGNQLMRVITHQNLKWYRVNNPHHLFSIFYFL